MIMRTMLVLGLAASAAGFRPAPGAAGRMAARTRMFAEAEADTEATPLESLDDRFDVKKGKVARGEGTPEEVALYIVDAEVPWKIMSALKNDVERSWANTMNVPGFRKGQIPPFMKDEVARFVCHTAVQEAMEEALKLYNLKATMDEEEDDRFEFVEVNGMSEEMDWMPIMAKEWKPKTSLKFHMEVLATSAAEEEA